MLKAFSRTSGTRSAQATILDVCEALAKDARREILAYPSATDFLKGTWGAKDRDKRRGKLQLF